MTAADVSRKTTIISTLPQQDKDVPIRPETLLEESGIALGRRLDSEIVSDFWSSRMFFNVHDGLQIYKEVFQGGFKTVLPQGLYALDGEVKAKYTKKELRV